MRANGKTDHTIQLDPDSIAWLRAKAKECRVPQGELVRRLIVDHKAMIAKLIERAKNGTLVR